MTALALTLPMERASPLRLARRDLVVAGGDDFTLQLRLVTADRPDATPIDMSGAGIGVLFVMSRQSSEGLYDYGLASSVAAPEALIESVLVSGPDGRVNVTLPTGLRSGRFWYEAHLDYDGGMSVLAHGALHIIGGPSLGGSSPAIVRELILAEDGSTITDDAFAALET